MDWIYKFVFQMLFALENRCCTAKFVRHCTVVRQVLYDIITIFNLQQFISLLSGIKFHNILFFISLNKLNKTHLDSVQQYEEGGINKSVLCVYYFQKIYIQYFLIFGSDFGHYFASLFFVYLSFFSRVSHLIWNFQNVRMYCPEFSLVHIFENTV